MIGMLDCCFHIQIRLAEAQQQKTMSQEMKPEQMEKMTKLEGWRQELKLLEGKKAEEASSWMLFCFSVRKLCSFPFAFLLAVRNKINQSRIFQPWLFNLLEPFWFRNHYFFFVDEGPLSVNFGLMSVFMVQVCLFTSYVQGNQTPLVPKWHATLEQAVNHLGESFGNFSGSFAARKFSYHASFCKLTWFRTPFHDFHILT